MTHFLIHPRSLESCPQKCRMLWPLGSEGPTPALHWSGIESPRRFRSRPVANRSNIAVTSGEAAGRPLGSEGPRESIREAPWQSESTCVGEQSSTGGGPPQGSWPIMVRAEPPKSNALDFRCLRTSLTSARLSAAVISAQFSLAAAQCVSRHSEVQARFAAAY